MASVGIRELRQNTSAVVRRAESGERLDVTVQGRVVAALVPPDFRTPRVVRLEDFAALDGLDPDVATAWALEVYGSRDDDPVVDPFTRG